MLLMHQGSEGRMVPWGGPVPKAATSIGLYMQVPIFNLQD